MLERLRRTRSDEETLTRLHKIIEVIEADPGPPAAAPDRRLKPGYYEQVAIIYRRRHDYAAEIAVLEHYQELIGWRKSRLSARLEEARRLARDAAGYA